MDPRRNKQKEDRWANQRDLVRRITSICTQLVPDDLGVHLRFINKELSHDKNKKLSHDNLRMDRIESIMSETIANGATEIGLNLRKRILEPMVYGKKMDRPIFVSITTDGVPGGPEGSLEKGNTLRNEIIRCQEYLLQEGLPARGNLIISLTYSTHSLWC